MSKFHVEYRRKYGDKSIISKTLTPVEANSSYSAMRISRPMENIHTGQLSVISSQRCIYATDNLRTYEISLANDPHMYKVQVRYVSE